MGGLGRTKGEANEKQSDGIEIHHQRGVLWLDSTLEKAICLMKNVLCLYWELCFLHGQGAHFQNNHEQRGQKVKNETG